MQYNISNQFLFILLHHDARDSEFCKAQLRTQLIVVILKLPARGQKKSSVTCMHPLQCLQLLFPSNLVQKKMMILQRTTYTYKN